MIVRLFIFLFGWLCRSNDYHSPRERIAQDYRGQFGPGHDRGEA